MGVLHPKRIGSKARFSIKVSVHVVPVNISNFYLGVFEVATDGKAHKVVTRVLGVASVSLYATATTSKIKLRLRAKVNGVTIAPIGTSATYQ